MTFISDLIIRSITLFIRVLPVGLFGPLAAVLAELIYRFSNRENRILKQNIANVLLLPADSHFSNMFRRQVYRHQIISTLETIRTAYQPSLLTMRGEANFRSVVSKTAQGQHGVIVVTGHIGSWEICARYCVKALPSTFHVLAKPSKNAAFTLFLDRMRILAGADVFWTDKRSLIKDILTALKAKEAVGFVMDQKPGNRKGPVVNFYNRPTEFVAGPATMAVRVGAPVVAVYCMRTAPFTYQLNAELVADSDHGCTDEVELTQRMAASIEAKIKDYPEQWTWNYKRWQF